MARRGRRSVDPATRYAQNVVSGKVVAGRLVRLACDRHLRDLETAAGRDLWWDWDAAERVLLFFRLLHHVKGRWARGRCSCEENVEDCPTRIRLEPWQVFIVGSIFAWKRRHPTLGWVRRYNLAYVQIARKNAKTTLATGVALYGLVADDEPGAEIYSAATKRDQAKICHDLGKAMVKRSRELRSHIAGAFHKTGNLVVYSTESKFEPLGADADTLDGLNPSIAIIDELHAHKTPEVFEALETGVGARDNALLFAITTAGKIWTFSICKATRDYCVQILEGEVREEGESVFAYIAELDAADEWGDESAWAKANPNLGVSITVEEMRDKAGKATANAVFAVGFKQKRLNLWTEDDGVGLVPMDHWEQCSGRLRLEDLRGRPAYGGLDLAAVDDLTSFALVFPPATDREKWRIRVWSWVPSERLRLRRIEERAIVDWARRGWIEETDGNTVDYDAVVARILEAADLYDIREIGFDPWNIGNVPNQLAGEGLEVVQVRQGFASMAAPTKYFLKLALEHQIIHGPNPVLTWACRNAKGRTDPAANVKPDKKSSSGKIDPLVATIIGLQRAMAGMQEDAPSIYESRAPSVR